jgi:hypothetical protein
MVEKEKYCYSKNIAGRAYDEQGPDGLPTTVIL